MLQGRRVAHTMPHLFITSARKATYIQMHAWLNHMQQKKSAWTRDGFRNPTTKKNCTNGFAVGGADCQRATWRISGTADVAAAPLRSGRVASCIYYIMIFFATLTSHKNSMKPHALKKPRPQSEAASMLPAFWNTRKKATFGPLSPRLRPGEAVQEQAHTATQGSNGAATRTPYVVCGCKCVASHPSLGHSNAT